MCFAEFCYRLRDGRRIDNDRSFAAFTKHYGPPNSSVVIGHQLILRYKCLDGEAQVAASLREFNSGMLVTDPTDVTLISPYGAPIPWTPDQLPQIEKAQQSAKLAEELSRSNALRQSEHVNSEARELVANAEKAFDVRRRALEKKKSEVNRAISQQSRVITSADDEIKRFPQKQQAEVRRRKDEETTAAKAKIETLSPESKSLDTEIAAIRERTTRLNVMLRKLYQEPDPAKKKQLLVEVRSECAQ